MEELVQVRTGCPSGERPRLLIDVSAILRLDAQTGIQRVVRAVWSELRGRSNDDLEVLPVYATRTQGYCFAPVDFLDRKNVRLGANPVSVRPGDKFLGLDLSAHLISNYRRQLQAWRAFGASIHLIVYDTLPLQHPDWFSSASASNFRRWFEVLVQEADQAICISDEVARDLRVRLKTMPPDVDRRSVGCPWDPTLQRRGLLEASAMMCGSCLRNFGFGRPYSWSAQSSRGKGTTLPLPHSNICGGSSPRTRRTW